MAEVTNSGLRLSAVELRDLTSWPDALIEEFLSLTRGVNNVIVSNNTINNTVDITEQVTMTNQAEIGYLRARLNAMAAGFSDLEALVADALTLAYKAINIKPTRQIAARVHAGQ